MGKGVKRHAIARCQHFQRLLDRSRCRRLSRLRVDRRRAAHRQPTTITLPVTADSQLRVSVRISISVIVIAYGRSRPARRGRLFIATPANLLEVTRIRLGRQVGWYAVPRLLTSSQ